MGEGYLTSLFFPPPMCFLLLLGGGGGVILYLGVNDHTPLCLCFKANGKVTFGIRTLGVSCILEYDEVCCPSAPLV
jgi:hypothetical protein